MGSSVEKMLGQLLSTFLFFLFAGECFGAVREYSSEITPEANTHWGKWGTADYCPSKTSSSFVHGFQLKVEGDCFQRQGRNLKDCDDTALNAIRLFCAYDDADYEAGYVESSMGPYGAWGSEQYCYGHGNYMTGVQFRSEPPQGHGDDTAGNNLNMLCSDGTT